MGIVDDMRKAAEQTLDRALPDRTPLYLLTGAGDLAAQKARELRSEYRGFPARTATLAFARLLEFNVRAAELLDDLGRRGQPIVDARLDDEPTAPREDAPRKTATAAATPRETAPRKTTARKTAPRKPAPRKTAARKTAPKRP